MVNKQQLVNSRLVAMYKCQVQPLDEIFLITIMIFLHFVNMCHSPFAGRLFYPSSSFFRVLVVIS